MLITNRPNQILRTEIQPGIATGDDHQVLYSELDISPYCIKQHPRKINLYNKADWPGFKELAKNIGVDIKSTKNTCTIEELWITLRNGLLVGTNQFIPQKTVKDKEWSPWIDKNLQKLIKRKKRAFTASKKTGKIHLEQKFQQLKRKVQKELRHAYWKHIENIITPTANNANNLQSSKNFWKFIKHQKKDFSGIPSLKVNGKLISDPQRKS